MIENKAEAQGQLEIIIKKLRNLKRKKGKITTDWVRHAKSLLIGFVSRYHEPLFTLKGMEIKLRGGNIISYEAVYPPEGHVSLAWHEKDVNGKPTGLRGYFTSIQDPRVWEVPYWELILEDYKKIKNELHGKIK